MVGAVFNEGVRGLQTSQREIQRSANDIARANTSLEPQEQLNREEPTSFQPLQESQESEPRRGIEESLIEMRRQEQIFNANAEVISVANDTLGSLIDVQS